MQKYSGDLERGDIITDGNGVYRVIQVRTLQSAWNDQVKHIQVSTIAGRVMGGLVRGALEPITVFEPAESNPAIGVEGIQAVAD